MTVFQAWRVAAPVVRQQKPGQALLVVKARAGTTLKTNISKEKTGVNQSEAEPRLFYKAQPGEARRGD
ncbi:MAG: hypothetical protein ACYC6V_00955 [Bacillota bacterium]